ncbi:MAG: hypothetical protein ABJB49_07830 [Nitrospirota bacterium]
MKSALLTMIIGGLFSTVFVPVAPAAQLPDILGIQLGMPAREAYAKLQADLPKNKLQVEEIYLPTIEKPVIVSFASAPQQTIGMGMEADIVKVYATLPPNKQAVWKVERTHTFPDKGIAKATLLASLREKYGKETVAWIVAGTPTTDDSKVTSLVWTFDEQGRPSVPPSNIPNPLYNCLSVGDQNLVQGPPPSSIVRNWCHTSYVGVMASLSTSSTPGLYDQMMVTIVNVPFALRAGDATVKWKNDIAEGKHKQEIEKAKQQEKPKL